MLGLGGEQVSELNVSGPTSTWAHTNIFAGGKLLATYHDSDTYFILTDWLGTKRAEYTPDDLRGTYFSLPYGNGPSTSGSAPDATEHLFTGKERDTESGNDYFGARYYASNMGRFMSPDPSGIAYGNPYNPQSLNLYSYALNNPLKFTDPTGLYCAWEDGTSDDDPSDGGASHSDCDAQGGHWTDESNPCHGADGCVATFDWNPQPQTQSAAITAMIGQVDTRALMLNYLRSCEGSAPGGGFGAYNDSLGNCTAGYGQLLHPHPCTAQDYAAHQGETQGQAEAQLEHDYDQANQFVQNNAPDSTQGQRDAFVDQAFNMGVGTPGGAHGMVNHEAWNDFTSGNNAAVPGDIMSLTAGGPGIRTRRANEVNMFTNGTYPATCY